MKLKSTPGPWDFCGTTMFGPHAEIICQFYWKPFSENFDNYAANARLIAESPEMLDALIESYRRYHQYEMDVDDDRPVHHVNFMDHLKSIIERATGMLIDEVLKGE